MYIGKIDKQIYSCITPYIDTGLVIKAIPPFSNHLFVVLRICTNSENGQFSNSIISGWKISKKRLQNYLKHKEVLYRKKAP